MKQFNFFILIYVIFLSTVRAQDITKLGDLPNVQVSKIDITTDWNNTGINISAGDVIIIIVNGIAATNGITVPNTIAWVGPEGMGGPDWIGGSGVPVPGAASHSVIGKIGTSGTPFYVGRNCSFTANISGQLYLGLNDEIFWDNYGYYIASIFKQPPPLVVAINEGFSTIINKYDVSQNYPNPFNPTTSFNFEIPNSSDVRIEIYDINGQKVRDLLNEYRDRGSHTITWDGKDNFGRTVSTGSYFYQIKTGNYVQTKKMILLK